MTKETDILRAAVAKAIAPLEGEFSSKRLARALIAAACDLSIADRGVMPTVWMTQEANGLLAGRWSPESIEMYIETTRN